MLEVAAGVEPVAQVQEVYTGPSTRMFGEAANRPSVSPSAARCARGVPLTLVKLPPMKTLPSKTEIALTVPLTRAWNPRTTAPVLLLWAASRTRVTDPRVELNRRVKSPPR